DGGRGQIGGVRIARAERHGGHELRELLAVARAVLLDERRARALRAREERLARSRELALLAEVLRASVRFDAFFAAVASLTRLRDEADRARRENRGNGRQMGPSH